MVCCNTQVLKTNGFNELLLKYNNLVNQKVSYQTFHSFFCDESTCVQLYFALKFDGHTCKCGREIIENYSQIKNKRGFRCRSCHEVIYPFANSLFASSPIPVNKIFWAIYLICSSSISSIELSDRVGLSYKSAHRLGHLIRTTLYNRVTGQFSGVVEVDEAFLGGNPKKHNRGKLSTYKQPIIGLVERGTKRARLFVVPNRSAKIINQLIYDHIEPGSTICTDSWRGYSGLSKDYVHLVVDHSKRQYVDGIAHTNSVESVWRHLRRNIKKSHIQIGNRYIQQYLDEACWRHNSKGQSPIQLFSEVLIRSTFAD